MVIKVDEKGNEALVKLVDVALKSGGIQVLQLVNTVAASIKVETETPEVKLEPVKEVKKSK